MKHFRVLLPLLVLALLLFGCSRELGPYEYVRGDIALSVDPADQTITHGETVYNYTMKESRSGQVSFVIDYPNGGIFHWSTTGTGGAGGGNDAYNETDYLPGPVLVDALEENMPREKTGSVFVGLILIALGGANFLWPELGFFLRYGWAVKDAEPSEIYIMFAKIGGALVAAFGLLWCFI